VKSQIAFSHVLLEDLGEWCGVCTILDRKTAQNRIEHEGVSFLTITLPGFAKDFERSLELGQVSDDLFKSFSRSGGLPRFLGGFLRLVFDRRTGALLDTPSVLAIRCVRQYCHAFAKIEVECSDERKTSAMARYVECEQELADAEPEIRDREASFIRTAWALFGDVLMRIESDLDAGDLVPRHGPGSTADRLTGNGKYLQSEWPIRLEPFMPAGEYLLPNWRHWQSLDGIKFLEPGEEKPVKVILVPKTLKTPRVIAMEPTCMQYAQQALSQAFMRELEGHDTLSALIGFTDQLPNQELALEGSLLGNLATLDLSEASDRVSNLLVLALLRRVPFLSGAVQGCRSTNADVLGHGIISLSKFASMGSALCFPIEAMVFLTIIAEVWAESQGHQFTAKDREALVGQVRVYGDDLIVPVAMAQSLSDRLEAYGLKVNRSKSFWNGKFRESCGGDFYDGEWVTPVRVRSVFPETKRQADAVASTVSLRNHFFEMGLQRSAEYIDDILRRVLPVYPELPRGHSALGRWTYGPVNATHTSKHLQIPLVRALTVHAPLPSSPLGDVPALMKFFIERSIEPLSIDAFMRAGRPSAVHIKLRKVPLMERVPR